MKRLLLGVAAGLALAVAYTASPLGVLFLVFAPILCLIAGRGLPADERRTLTWILGAALAARLIVVVGMFAAGFSQHSDLAVGALSGDEAYNLGRALRTRDILLGFPSTHYDYFVVTDQYGRTSYLQLLTQLLVVFGPAPYGIRLLNALLFVGGAAILFRIVRPGFGAWPSFAALVIVVFLPSVFFASISLLKESLYFLAAATLLAAVISGLRARTLPAIAGAIALTGLSLWILDDLRRGAIVLTTAGLACGLAIRMIAGVRWRLTTAAVAVALAGVAVAVSPSLSDRVLRGLESMAKTHSGHVFTVGHSYKLLDDGFYMNPTTPAASTIRLTPAQAARFVIRGAVSFIVTPLPWETISRSERLFLPEHMLWYLLLACLPFGLVAGWQRDPLLTSILIGFVLPTAAALAYTNGNVGTLLRLRGLVSPYLAWISALGLCSVLNAWLASSRFKSPSPVGLRPEGTAA